MEWYVYFYNFNMNKIEVKNVFEISARFNQEFEKIKKIKDKQEFTEKLKDELKYNFNGRVEYETVITGNPAYISNKEYERIVNQTIHYRLPVNIESQFVTNVYYQISINFDQFVEYIWREING